jgi:hypothetical protein
VRALKAGFSGAFVLWVVSSTSGNKRDVENVLKISNSPLPLRDELRRMPVVGSVLDLHSVTPHTTCVEANGWSAIAIRPVKDAVLLRDFVLKGRAKRVDHRILSDMIADLLIPPAKTASPRSASPSANDHLLGFCAGSQILDVLDQMSKWGRLSTNLKPKDVVRVAKFIERSLQGHWSLCGNYHVARLHGDFHCRNVFVSPSSRALLIDFGRSEDFPRLLDFAALEADLLLSVLDSTGGSDLGFAEVERWYEYACADFPFRRTSEGVERTESRLSLLRKLVHTKMLADLENVTQVEYSEGLLFQFLRYLRFPTTTAPKKVLATRLAANLIHKHGIDT